MLKLTILAKESISIDTLCEDPPDKVTFPPEPIYEDNVENSTAQSERDRKTRNEQQEFVVKSMSEDRPCEISASIDIPF